ncbi:MAG: Y-family DNA polymerase [Methylotenera sp.]|uniref:Y-family DNA polymerase n=1 Tax=Methylotenera sp. TaxID=2051956 RepID=UPI002487AF97|nr:Y-family DNA polymerase [Methylotenera sp.]MDI1308233.1 Y-family DNA polymerase [Methylotenera sp.]
MSTHSNKTVYALADVNSMYASCEQVFRPDLKNSPIVVLSNNDGCAIAQNQLAKDLLGMHMAQPWHELEAEGKRLGVKVFSSNYELYAEMSNRFIDTLREFSPRVEVYSIDECFLDMTGINKPLTEYGHLIRDTVKQWTSLPICVGFGHSKTLAKLANHCAKKQPIWKGVCDLTNLNETELNSLLENLQVSKVWGIGSRLEVKLNNVGIHTVARLRKANPKRIRDAFGVLVERTIKELNGEVWLDLDDSEIPLEAKQVLSSRSFGERVTELKDINEAISFHATNACQRLRKQGLYANTVYAFIQNSPFDKATFYSGNETIGLPSPTDDTLRITQAALWLVKRIYSPNIYYQKAGIMLGGLVPKEGQQLDLLGYTDRDSKSENLMIALDGINKKYGRGTLKLASEGIDKTWRMRRSFKSPNYMGDFLELPLINSNIPLGFPLGENLKLL